MTGEHVWVMEYGNDGIYMWPGDDEEIRHPNRIFGCFQSSFYFEDNPMEGYLNPYFFNPSNSKDFFLPGIWIPVVEETLAKKYELLHNDCQIFASAILFKSSRAPKLRDYHHQYF